MKNFELVLLLLNNARSVSRVLFLPLSRRVTVIYLDLLLPAGSSGLPILFSPISLSVTEEVAGLGPRTYLALLPVEFAAFHFLRLRGLFVTVALFLRLRGMGVTHHGVL